tara:strand:- start:260 stop:436 length:177 start_codon:yes stop_codon:yes gene_type:complete
MNNIEFVLAVIGSLSLGYITFKGVRWLWVRRTLISLKNPLKTYIRKQVVEYLKELKDE